MDYEPLPRERVPFLVNTWRGLRAGQLAYWMPLLLIVAAAVGLVLLGVLIGSSR